MNDSGDKVPAEQSDERATAERPDIDRVVADEWPQREFPIEKRRRSAVRVVIKQSVLNDIHQHGQSRTDVEICGVMIGEGYRDEHGPFVYVEGNIRGQHSDSQVAQVTFTGETWNHIHNELDQKFPELRILGWYHTHPGFGVFLSGMDLFIHENYFSGNEQLALVYDPIGGDEGLFVWREGVAQREGFSIERDTQEDPPVRSGPPPREEPATAGAGELKHSDDLQWRIDRIERRQNLGTLALLAVGMLAIAAPFVGWFLATSPLPARIEKMPSAPHVRDIEPAESAPQDDETP